MAEQIQRVKYQITGENLSGSAFDKVKRDLSSVTESAKNFSGAIAAIGAGAIFAGITSQAQQLLGSIAALDDASEKTGATVENLSRFNQVLKLTGGSAELLETSLIKFNKTLNTVGDGSQDARNALAAIGLDLDTLAKKDPAEALELVAKALANFGDTSSKTAVATALLGKSGAQLLPFLKDIVQYGGLAAKVTGEQASAAEKLQNELRRFSLESENTKQAILLNLLGPITNLLEQFRKGKEIAGGFFSALLNFGVGLSPSQTGDPGKAIADIDQRIAKQKELVSLFGKVGLDGIPGIGLETLEKQREFLRLLQQQKVLQDNAGRDTAGEQARFGLGAAKPAIDFKLGDKPPAPAKINPRNDEADQILKLNRAVSEAALSVDREINQQRLAALQEYQSASLLSVREYYQLRRDITQQGVSQELRDIDTQIAAQEARISQARQDANAGNAGGQPERVDAANKAIVDSTERIIKLQAERQKIQIANSGQIATLTLQEKTAVDNLAGAVVNLNAQLMAIKGDTVGAALAQFDEANRKLRQDLTNNAAQFPEATNNIDSLRAQVEAQEKFNKAKLEFDDINARLALSEERISIAQRLGGVGELGALRQRGEARKAAVVALEQQFKLLQDIGASSNNPRLALLLEQTQVQIESLSSELDPLGDKLKNTFNDAALGPLADFITGTKTAGEAFKAFAQSVIRSLVDIQSKNLLASLFGGSGAGNAGSLLGNLFGGAQQPEQLGGPGFTGSGAASSAVGGILSALFKGAFGFANGGSFNVGGSGGTDSQLVAFRASPNERVTVQTPAQQAAGGGGGVTIVQHNTFNGDMPHGTLLALLDRNKRETIAAVAQLRQRGGSYSLAMGR